MNRKTIPYKHQSRGFTLIEFLVASALGVIVIAAVGSFYFHTRELNEIAINHLEEQQDLRNAATMITRDARLAGSFGCLSLGMMDKTDLKNLTINKINISSQVPLIDVEKAGSTLPDTASFGIQWVDPKSSVFGNVLPGQKVFNPQFKIDSKVLIFYYGSGSSGLDELKLATGNSIDSVSFVDKDPNATLQSVANNKGVFALSSCRALTLFQLNTSPSIVNDSFTIKGGDIGSPIVSNNPSSLTPGQFTADSLALLKYQVIAYAVGHTTADPKGSKGLYRMELADDGSWQGPELLARDVDSMNVRFFYNRYNNISGAGAGASAPADECPASGAAISTPQFIVSDDARSTLPAISGGAYYAPSALEVTLQYTYPEIQKSPSATKVSSGDGKPHNYMITATIRGGNICANQFHFKKQP